MILLDYRPVAVANLMVGIGRGFHADSVSEHSLRSMILTTVKKVVREYSPGYGKLVIASEGDRYWRRDYFPYYKANRKSRTDAGIDWREVVKIMDSIRDEIAEFMPYVSVHVPEAEADDVIAVLATSVDTLEPKLIVSGDRDFVQLQQHPGVEQYDYTRDRWVRHADPAAQLKEKIIRGDAGDGVPNFLTDGDVFVTPGKRSRPIMTPKFEAWMKQDPSEFCDTQEKKDNWERNKTLVDFSSIPEAVKRAVLNRYAEAAATVPPRHGVAQYLTSKRLAMLAMDAQDF